MVGLTGAAAAALGSLPPLPRPDRLSWVDVESPPRMIEVVDPVTGGPLGWYAEVDESLGMTDAMATKFRSICDHVDGNECEADDCVASLYERDGVPVGRGIGWVLAGDADERTEWAPPTLVQREKKVIAVCMECSPSALYQNLWLTDDEKVSP